MKQYFQQELDNLLKQAAEFSQAHPNIAPLISETSSDPDVKRLFEGVAFLTALLREKIDDEFPEIVHELTRLCWPHYIRPLPSATIIKFTPMDTLEQSTVVPAGVYIDSVPVDGVACRFQTRRDVDLHPMSLSGASWIHPPGSPPAIKLVFKLRGLNLSSWRPRSLRLFLADRYFNASNLYLRLSRRLSGIIVRTSSGKDVYHLPAENLQFDEVSLDNPLFPYPPNSFSGYGLIQEYFVMPEKFLFCDLKGIENWRPKTADSEFEVIFELKPEASETSEVLDIDKNSFQLFAVPAINVFEHFGVPVIVDHRKDEYPVMPEGKDASHYAVFSLDKVVGVTRGTTETVEFQAFHDFHKKDNSAPVYNETLRQSKLRRNADTFITLAYQDDIETSRTLAFDLTCTNGDLAEHLAAGDICKPTDNSPEFATFRNLTPPTKSAAVDIQSNFLWKLLSHLALNYAPISNADNFKELLRLYIPENKNQGIHSHMLKGISNMSFKHINRMIGGIMMTGTRVDMKLRHDYFAGEGDMCLFADMVNVFMGIYSSINSFTKLTVEDLTSGDYYQWPERVGARPLI